MHLLIPRRGWLRIPVSILVIYCRLIVLSHMMIVDTIRMFELVILNVHSFQRRYVEFHFCKLHLIDCCYFEPHMFEPHFEPHMNLILNLICTVYALIISIVCLDWSMLQCVNN